jgi:tetratricopeptide (TPR) repeat protein
MLARARALGDPLHLSTALTILALAHMWRRNPKETFETAQQALRVARDAGSLVWQGRALSLYHWAATIREPDAAMAHFTALSTGLNGLLSAGPYGRTAFTPCLVEVYARAGHVSMAFEELDDALAYVERSDERAWSSELHRLRGELLKDSDPDTAERAMTTALQIARQQGARSFELRAALSLTGIAREPKRHRAAIEDLRRVFMSFTEGFETGDLVEAKAVLARYTPV